jgi:septum site-determining protein MinD
LSSWELLRAQPGLNEETLLAIAISDVLIILLRPDHQDYQGTAVAVEVARKLDVPRLLLMVNKVPSNFDLVAVQDRVQRTYAAEVAAVVAHSDEMMALGSGGIFALRHPDHPLTAALRRVAARLVGDNYALENQRDG